MLLEERERGEEECISQLSLSSIRCCMIEEKGGAIFVCVNLVLRGSGVGNLDREKEL